jgi:hypothetical protein
MMAESSNLVAESAWVIEMAGERSEPLYWHAEPDMRCIGGFDPDVNKAMRFCREQDAKAMALMLGAKGMIALTDVRRVRITEHEWTERRPDETTALLPADQKLKEFFSKHALGPLARPSCIVCGDVPKDWPPAIQHMELPGIVVCFPCRDAAQATSRHEHKWTPWWNDNSGTQYRYCSCGDQESIAVRAPNTSSGGS